MINTTDIFEFKAKLNKIMISLCDSELPKAEKDAAIYYLTKVIDAAEETLKC